MDFFRNCTVTPTTFGVFKVPLTMKAPLNTGLTVINILHSSSQLMLFFDDVTLMSFQFSLLLFVLQHMVLHVEDNKLYIGSRLACTLYM